MDEGAVQERPLTTAMGLVTDAKEMLKAAEILHESEVWKVQGPTYYLLGHAIEVALKAFLLARGESLARLKKRYGHDISKVAKRVIAAKHNSVSPLVQEYLQEIELLGSYYKAKEFEYRVTGAKTYPKKERLISLLRSVIPLIEPVAYEAYPAR